MSYLSNLFARGGSNMGYVTPNSNADFVIPPNLYRRSGSNLIDQQYSGLDLSNPIVRSVMPSLIGVSRTLPGFVQQIPHILQGQYANLMNQALSPEAMQGTLSALASKGLLNSSMASDALGLMGTKIAQDVGNKGYNSFLAGLQARMQLPSILSGVLGLGRVSTGARGSTSYSVDPLEPYRLMAQLLMY